MPEKFSDELTADVTRAIELTRQLDTYDETCSHFVEPEAWESGDSARINHELNEVERRIDRTVATIYGMPDDADSVANLTADRTELARRWIGYTVGVLLGMEKKRWCALDHEFGENVRAFLKCKIGATTAGEIDSAVCGIGRFLAKDFSNWHNTLYRMRPVIWVFTVRDRTIALGHQHATRELLSEIGIDVPMGWDRWVDDGIAINLTPLWQNVADAKLRKSLRALAADLQAGKHAFARTAQALYPKMD